MPLPAPVFTDIIAVASSWPVWKYSHHRPITTTDQGFCPQRLPAHLWTSCLENTHWFPPDRAPHSHDSSASPSKPYGDTSSRGKGQIAHSQGREVESRASHTQAEEVDSTIIQEVADVSDILGHGAEGVCTAGHKGVHTAGAHIHKQRPGVAVILDICHIQCGHKPPHEEPVTTQCDPLNPCG